MQIIEATQAHLSEIKTFLNQNPLEHIHLDWGSVEQWVNKKNYLLQYNDDDIIGLLSCPPSQNQTTWVRQFAIKKFHKPSEVWHNLFLQSLESLSVNPEPLIIYSLSIWDWYERILKNAGFVSYQEIVTLEWQNSSKTRYQINQPPNTHIRQIVNTDIADIVSIDQLSFDAPWALSKETIINALLNYDYASVTLKDDKIVGYLISSQSVLNAHISRIAIRPEYQGKKLGQDLMRNCIQYYIDKNIRTISVNTQKDNLASLSLYKRFGFEDLRDNFPVFQYSV